MLLSDWKYMLQNLFIQFQNSKKSLKLQMEAHLAVRCDLTDFSRTYVTLLQNIFLHLITGASPKSHWTQHNIL